MKTRLLLLLPLLAACVSVDSTEHCVQTRYGTIIENQMKPGLHFSPIADATCFSLTDQNYPADSAEHVEAQTSDPVTIDGDVTIVYRYEHVVELFKDKRSTRAAETEVRNAIREGFRTAMAGWSIEDLFSSRRAAFADSVRVHIQRKLDKRANIRQVYVRALKAPQQIEQARIAAARQAQILDQARKQKTIDSTNAVSTLFAQEMSAKANRLQMEALAASPQALQLKSMEALANGLANMCKGVTTCIVGGNVVDKFLAGGKQ